MQLTDAAKIAKDAGRRSIEDLMDARKRFSPWEINEAWLQIAIAQEMHRAARTPGSPSWRIHDEYPEGGITNVLSDDSHPIDIVILHPLAASDDPWSAPAWELLRSKRGGAI